MSKMTSLVALLSVIAIILTGSAFGQESDSGVGVKTTQITDKIYRLSCSSNYDVNVIASIGDDGILLVDAGFEQTAAAVRTSLANIGRGEIKYIINTHAHNDHTGGNKGLGDKATIIAHENVRSGLSGEYFGLPGFTDEGVPSVTFTDTMSIFFNGEQIKLIHFPGGHTNGDIIVLFTKSKVACLGDLLFAGRFPYVDVRRGGDVEIFAENVKKVLDMVPSNYIIVGGHEEECEPGKVHQYHEMLTITTELIRKPFNEGKTAKEIFASGLLAEWDGWGWHWLTSTERWITWVHQSLTRRAGPEVKSIAEPLSYTITQKGIAAAVEQYRLLKETQPEKYTFGEFDLNMLGYQLLARLKTEDAIEIFKLYIEGFPESFNSWDSMGEAYMLNGDTQLAIAHYEKSLELNPENENAVRMLEQLRTQ